jgi:hypothetical protein
LSFAKRPPKVSAVDAPPRDSPVPGKGKGSKQLDIPSRGKGNGGKGFRMVAREERVARAVTVVAREERVAGAVTAVARVAAAILLMTNTMIYHPHVCVAI